MQTGTIVQAVVLVMIVAVAASCSASKEYTSKLFTPREAVIKDSQAVALRFLELDNLEPDQDNWVTTDIIMGRDTLSKTMALDKLSRVFPANGSVADSGVKTSEAKSLPVMADTRATGGETVPVKTNPVVSDSKPVPAETVPVAKAANPGEIRNKRSRDER